MFCQCEYVNNLTPLALGLLRLLVLGLLLVLARLARLLALGLLLGLLRLLLVVRGRRRG